MFDTLLDLMKQEWFWIAALVLWAFWEIGRQAAKVVTGTAKIVASPVGKGFWSFFNK